MIENQEVSLAILVKNYAVAKANLMTVIESTDSSDIEKAEIQLAACFESLLAEKPKTIDDMLVKFQLFFSEIKSEAELTQYHNRALENILDNLKSYKDLQENDCSDKAI